MLDSHCHIDHFSDPIRVMRSADERGVFVVAVTNLPSQFVAGRRHVQAFKRVRLALGLHPLTAMQHPPELALFEQMLTVTSFVGEVGLDFSREGKATERQQLDSFRFVARLLATTPKFTTLHSRGAERAVLDIMAEFGVSPAVFHWYTGPLSLIGDIVGSGHFFSVNPTMTSSAKGRKLIEALPQDRVLTESDGPYGRIGGRPCHPWELTSLEEHLAQVWSCSPHEAREVVWRNFRRITSSLVRSSD